MVNLSTHNWVEKHPINYRKNILIFLTYLSIFVSSKLCSPADETKGRECRMGIMNQVSKISFFFSKTGYFIGGRVRAKMVILITISIVFPSKLYYLCFFETKYCSFEY